MKPIIRVENLSKQYRIGAQQASYGTFRDTLTNAVTAPFRHLRNLTTTDHRPPTTDHPETIWALKDINFEVQPGEVVGIIGRNGAGKSTLLKILSRITEPTAGKIDLHGRVSSLLEVGTGFHPELTGRENIYLNGAVLGMKRAEITRKFDEIVAFAEIEKFLDTPVKHYSSGMYMRLAFSVAAHLEPEILVVDEVLAVGDSTFQNKCIGKMGEVARQGRTVLFVSHNMVAIQNLCARGIVLKEGQIFTAEDVANAIAQYTKLCREIQAIDLCDRTDRLGNQFLTFTKVTFHNLAGKLCDTILSGQNVVVRFNYVAREALQDAMVNIAFNVRSPQGNLISNLNSIDSGNARMNILKSGYFECLWPKLNLRSGVYDSALFCQVNGEVCDWLQSAFTIEVEDGDFFSTGKLISRDAGDVLIDYSWRGLESNDQ